MDFWPGTASMGQSSPCSPVSSRWTKERRGVVGGPLRGLGGGPGVAALGGKVLYGGGGLGEAGAVGAPLKGFGGTPGDAAFGGNGFDGERRLGEQGGGDG